MGSSASDTTETTTNNLALDRDTTNGAGMQILNSVIVDPSDELMIRTIAEHRATFEVLTSNSTIQLSQMLGLGEDILALADSQAIRLEGMAYKQLETGVEMLQAAQKNGKYVIDLTEKVAAASFELAGDALGGSESLASKSLDIVADLKTENYAETLKILSVVLVTFGLGAIYLATKD